MSLIAFIAAALFVSAHGLAAEADAIAISRNIQALHLPHGTILDPVFAGPASNQIVSYSRCGDSAIWTGHYLAAEAFRYKVTGSAEALLAARRAFDGIKSLVDVTGTNLLARCIMPVSSPYAQAMTQEEAHHGVYRNTAQEPNYFWIGNTSRDQYSGVMFGLAVAYDMIEEPGFRSNIRELVRRLVDFLRGNEWIVRMPDGKVSTTFIHRADQQLAFLQIARHMDPDRYSTAYDIARILLSPTVAAPIALEVLDNSSYFKFNLNHINLYGLIRYESSSFGSIFRNAYEVLRRHTDDHGNPFFNMVDRALSGPDPARDRDTLRMLDEWLLRPRRDAYVDLRNKYPVCAGQDETCDPIPIVERVRTDFLWQRSPYLLYGGGSGLIETAGIDYILPYWMARFYGLSGYEVRSAASGGSVTAPDSIASVYGANLQNIARAEVRDSAQVSRPATIFYTSAGQINLLIPAGTSTGVAMVLLYDAQGNSISAITEVRRIAPALFSSNGTGSGPAAGVATGISVQPVLTSDCSASGCVAAPVNSVTHPYISLYGTGIRGGQGDVAVTFGSVRVPVLYAGAQGDFAGLDQVNVQVPASLRGAGEVNVTVAIGNDSSNTVRIRIQ